MPGDYTTAALLASIRRRGMLPNSGDALDDSDLLVLANEELQEYVVPFLLSVNEEYLVATADQQLTPGLASYPIPSRAVGGKLRDVKLLVDGTFASLERVEPERDSDYVGTGDVLAFKIQGNSVVLLPTPATPGTLRFVFYRRPAELVALPSSSVGQIYQISADTPSAGFTMLRTTGANWISSGGKTFDVVRSKPGFESLMADLVGSYNPGQNQMYFPSQAVPPFVAVGDYLCLADQAPVPQLPLELHPLLVQRTVVRALEAIGDARAEAADARCERTKKELLTLLSPRTEGKGRVIVNRNAPGFGRFRRGWFQS